MLGEQFERNKERIKLLTAQNEIAERFMAAVCQLPGYKKACEELVSHRIHPYAAHTAAGEDIVVIMDADWYRSPGLNIMKELLGKDGWSSDFGTYNAQFQDVVKLGQFQSADPDWIRWKGFVILVIGIQSGFDE